MAPHTGQTEHREGLTRHLLSGEGQCPDCAAPSGSSRACSLSRVEGCSVGPSDSSHFTDGFSSCPATLSTIVRRGGKSRQSQFQGLLHRY